MSESNAAMLLTSDIDSVAKARKLGELPPTPPHEKEVTPQTINDVLLHLLQEAPDLPLVGYPKSSHRVSDYAYYTARDLDGFANGAVEQLNKAGLSKFSHSTENRVVAILGPSSLDYIVSLFALTRLGYAVLLLSTRLSTEAYVNLLKATKCTHLLYSPSTAKAVNKLDSSAAIATFQIPEHATYSRSAFESTLQLTDNSQLAQKWAFIIHSSGSTGLPKPIFQTHGACIANYSTSKGYRALLTLPLYHNHGLSTFFRSLFKRKPVAIYNANLPLTGNHVLETMQTTGPESFHGVPYVLKLLSEVEGGVAALAQCQQVLFGGSSCPDDLGDLLVNQGVRLISHYGATELGQLMTSERPPEDKAWNYVRPLNKVAPFLKMIPLEDGSYECVVLDGLPAKVSSNSDDPPNSFHTRDTFLKHPSIPNAWKYLGRLDDRITLVNGEKVLPVPIEHRIRQSRYVQDNLVYGVGRPLPGLLVVPSVECQGMTKSEILDKVWPDIAAANKNSEAFSQISRNMVIVLDPGCSYPATDKGTMIRNRCYLEFGDLIEGMYRDIQGSGSAAVHRRVFNSVQELEQFLLTLFRTELGFQDIDVNTDFFDAGVDSLQAIKARGMIQDQVDIGSAQLSHNVIYDCANIRKLAARLVAARTGQESSAKDELSAMARLISIYSTFASRPAEEETVLLTGTTGSLGVYILSRLMQKPSVKKVYCLVRAASPSDALDRVLSSLATRSLPMINVSKIVALPSQFGREDLGLTPPVLDDLRQSLTKVIHAAWAVNFTLGVESFEQQHIRGVHNLINLCLSSTRSSPAEFYFCSSISAAAGTPLPATIAEGPIPELSHAQNMGYARSKLVAERIIQAAAETTGMVAKVLRVGQIVGDTVTGKWNCTEAIPLMLQTAKTLQALPALDETPAWLPVDVVAEAVLELSGITPSPEATVFARDPTVVYHVQNSKTFRWTEDLLPALRQAGLNFEILPKREWIQRLRASDPDPTKNPAIKLLDFFTDKYDNESMGRSGLSFQMEKTEAASPSLKGGVELIETGLIRKFVDVWRTEW
ncbi:putative NRPS-like enzyme [Aspergillus homomorphus CBS 101889]|uniref:Putative NRPS-like enzyme n=1 Tax=Aspergillus homomorphus (strain CBS 101889) TaxID=1450537 RepID=A0A395IAD1_ASPHC|nr:putative NRPS-like enzyme [Aspergillus homomorphus CBS 101889]RAL16759.1 putative NRPS-like enzyme [Aspergillus homomorphus CBS 101889]